METNKLPPMEIMLGVRSEGGSGTLEEMPLFLQYFDQKRALCELQMPAGQAMRLLAYLQMVQRRYGLSIPDDSGGR